MNGTINYTKDNLKSLFTAVGITEDKYPEYKNPEHFAEKMYSEAFINQQNEISGSIQTPENWFERILNA